MIINSLHIGDRAKIKTIRRGDPAYRQKLIAMGLTPGTELTLLRIAPLGDPVEVLVRGVSLSLRQAEAAILELEGV